MKKIILALVFSLTFAFAASAQDRSINFESTRSWAKIVQKASTEDKLIFVDCYTDWCGPCKQLAARVFTNNDVADYFNEKFVNAKFNMEKDSDAILLAEKWGVKSYPTLLFIDPKTELIVHKVVGAGPPDWLIKAGRAANDPNANLAALIARYDSGQIGPRFVGDLVEAVKGAGEADMTEQIISNYFAGMDPERMATEENWALIYKYAEDPLLEPLKTVWENRELFYEIPVQDQQNIVDGKLAAAVLNTAAGYATKPTLIMIYGDRYTAFVDFLSEQVQSPVKEMAAVWINTSNRALQNNWGGVLEAMQIVVEEKILPEAQLGQYLSYFCKGLGEKGKKAEVDDCLKWLDTWVATVEGEDIKAYYTRAMATEAKVRLLHANGRVSPAQKAQKDMQAYGEKLNELAAQMQAQGRMNR